MIAKISIFILIFYISCLGFIDTAQTSVLGEKKQCSPCSTCAPCNSCSVPSPLSCDICPSRTEKIEIPLKNSVHPNSTVENGKERRSPFYPPGCPKKKCKPCPPKKKKKCKKCKKCPPCIAARPCKKCPKLKPCKCKCHCRPGAPAPVQF
ncbi:uncharacterized protein [Parasteatoda tepidariorum]|uniref:uncharacterized protein isoform X2 n=1 Tax=Parasteatoda tepidariorum TaxID=114398 RepID=UPI00077FC0B2|nr:DBF4-type zinc finger-containing protein 2 homolog [Parasteatoda tepidariorum]